MSKGRTYLEMSEEGANKFYEVVVKGKVLTVRYGRIGAAGTTSSKTFDSPAAARAEAKKKIDEKTRNGYAPATASDAADDEPAKPNQAPVLWKFETGSWALGIFIDEDRCWVGNNDGRVFVLDHEGKVRDQYKLPKEV